MQFFGHRPGSLRETIAISFPLMLSSLSIYLMYFFERCVLAWFSLDTLNAAVQASSLCWAFWGGMTIVAGMAEIFISRHNGRGHCKNIGTIVWQTLWLSLAAGVIFMAIGIFGTPIFYQTDSPEASYFRWSMTFGVLNLVVYSLTTFFVGRGKVKWMLALTMATCLLNLGLDFALIFGIDAWIPSLGATGAAMASAISLSLQSILLLAVFLKRSNRERFGTSDWRMRPSMMLSIVKISAFPAILYNVELLGWSIFYIMMAQTGSVYITVSSLCQSLIYLFTFVGEGLSRGATLQSSTYLASGSAHTVRKVLCSGGIILLACFTLQALFLILTPSLFLKIFLPLDENALALVPAVHLCTWFVLLYLLFQGFQWLLSGLLCATGRTLSMSLCGISGLFFCLLGPTYILIIKNGYSVSWAWALVASYSLFCCLAYLQLFKRAEKRMALLNNAASESSQKNPEALPEALLESDSLLVTETTENFFGKQAAAQ